MRTLKKTLCLVLALAMMVGLCAVGASAITVNDYKDKDQIPNMEAFATLTAIGVFQGDDQGNVNPNAALKRAEGATLAAKMHATSGSGVSSFTDMDAYAWAQPAVAFCEANGIINGYGDGTFGPGDALSTVAFAKICLCALGWNAEKEGLVGPQWEINTIKLVNALNLADGIGNPDWNANIPRWQAAQFCYNTLQATMVDYNNGFNFTVTTTDGTKVEVGNGASPVENNSYDYRNELKKKDGVVTGNTMQFCEQYFPLLKMDTAGSVDFFGFKSNAWYMGDTRVDRNRTTAKTIVTVNASETMAVYDTNIATVTGKTLYTDGKSDGKTEHSSLTVVVNGYELTTDIEMNRFGVAPLLKQYAGATAYLLDTDDMDKDGYGIADKLIVKQPLLAKVTKVTEASAKADRTLTLTVYDNAATPNAGVKFISNDYAKGDFILVYPNFGAKDAVDFTADPIPFSSELATTAAGTLTKLTNKDASSYASMVIGGVSYSIGANANLANGYKVENTSNNYVLGTGMTAYLSNGFILGVVSDAVAYGDYVFSVGTADVAGGALNPNTTYKVGYVDQAAVSAEVTGANIKATASSTDNNNGIWSKDQMKNVWATVTETKGAYSFKPAKSLTKYFSLASLNSAKPTLGTAGDGTAIVADNNTVFILRDPTYRTFKAYTGLNNVPNYADSSKSGGLSGVTAYALVPDTYAGAHAAAVYIDLNTGAKPTNTTTATIYLVNSSFAGKEQGADGKTYYNFTAIINGEIKPVLATKDGFVNYGVVIPAYSGEYLDTTDDGGAVVNHESISQNSAYVLNADNGLLTIYFKDLTKAVYTLAPDAVAYVYSAANRPLETGDTLADVLNGLYDENVKTDSTGTDVTISVVLNKAGFAQTIYVNKADVVA